MSSPSLVIMLVEDERQEMLIYRYLKLCRLRVRIPTYPVGRGSAENWVLKRFAVEVGEYRRRQARAETGLIVAIDADSHTVEERFAQLDRALKENGERKIGKSERISQLIPKRNVETWILCLNHEPNLDERSDYKNQKHKWHKLIPPAAETLCRWAQSKTQPPPSCLSSLRIGIRELKRLRR